MMSAPQGDCAHQISCKTSFSSDASESSTVLKIPVFLPGIPVTLLTLPSRPHWVVSRSLALALRAAPYIST